MSLLSAVGEYWPSFLAFALFGGLHSVCAQDAFKTRLAHWTSPFVVEHFWRFPYCVLSYLALYHGIAVLHWGWHPAADTWLLNYPDWLWDGLVIVHLGSIGVMYVAFVQSDYLEFWGLRQLCRGLRALRGRPVSPSSLDLFGTHRLVVRGIYGWIRHPMLIGGFLFLVTSGPSKNNLVFAGMYATYMLLGAYVEERRLLRIFGDPYRRYRREVGAFSLGCVSGLAPRRADAGTRHGVDGPVDLRRPGFHLVLQPAHLLGGPPRARPPLRGGAAEAVIGNACPGAEVARGSAHSRKIGRGGTANSAKTEVDSPKANSGRAET